VVNFNNNLLSNDLKSLKKLVIDYQSEFLNFYKLNKEFKTRTDNNFSGAINPPEIFKDFLNIYHIPDYSFRIGSVVIKNPVICAPLAGISDNTYRIFAKAFGSSLSFTEMISSYGVYFNSSESILLSNITDFERPCGIQIFGSEPAVILESAQKLEDKADMIDLNMGCPVPKVLKSKSGGFLLQDENRVEKIISEVISKIKKPLTIKVRTGWDKNNINVERIAKIAESLGVSAVTIHGRTVKQGFSGDVNYEVIKEVKKKIKIPVIVSGDIDTPLKAKRVLDFTGCDAVMIGRAARGSLWVMFNVLMAFYKFYSNDQLLNNKDPKLKPKNNSNNNEYSNYFNYHPPLAWRKKFAELYLKFMIYFKGEDKAVKEFRKYLAWIFKGVAGIGKVRKDFYLIDTYDRAVKVIGDLNNFY